MLKGGKAPSLWLRNMQLAAYSALIALVSIFSTADPIARQQVRVGLRVRVRVRVRHRVRVRVRVSSLSQRTRSRGSR
jgi:hypothetical protein